MSRAFAGAALVLLAASVSAQNLGEAAAKERRERQQKAPLRVITEEELAANNGRLANDPTVVPATAEKPQPYLVLPPDLISMRGGVVSPSSGLTVVDVERDRRDAQEAHWRAEAQRRRAELAVAEWDVQRTARWSDPTYAGEDRPSCPIAARNEQKKARASLARARQRVESLEDEARRGGALPGWVR